MEISAKIPVPILNDEIQKSIAKIVQESLALDNKSKQLLEHAKQAIEMAIERDEDTALRWFESKLAHLEV